MKITDALHKIFTKLARKYQALLGIATIGPRAIVLNEKNQVLLVKHCYPPYWYLPGGGTKKRESAKTALLRELKEETGIVASPEQTSLFGIYYHNYLGVDDYPIIYVVKNYTQIANRSSEIQETGRFDYSALPEDTSPGTKRRLREFFEEAVKSEVW